MFMNHTNEGVLAKNSSSVVPHDLTKNSQNESSSYFEIKVLWTNFFLEVYNVTTGKINKE